MTLSPGAHLGSFQIVSPLGAGGMGEVFRARDTRLARDVAIKLLPEAVVDDPQRLARFRREAKVVASLNHPNIAAIYGLEESEGGPFLVLELVEGETLQQRLVRGRIPLDEALAIARQLAEALEEAHEHGVVHRDLKPANVKLTPEGKAKVLDFGLAKACAGEGEPDRTDSSQSPTVTALGTESGVILGTAAYMSPEQARGRRVDKRTDIWAFGVVLFEMLTGTRLFRGETASDTLAAVLTADPAWSLLPPETPRQVRKLLHRCLACDPRERLRDIGDARLDLDPSGGELEAPVAGGPAEDGRRTQPLAGSWPVVAVAFAAAALVGGGAGVWLHSRSTTKTGPRPVAIRFTIALPDGIAIRPSSVPAVAPGGDTIAFTASRADQPARLWTRRLAGTDAVELSGTDDAISPFWSPDGGYVGFFTLGREIRKIPAEGGPVEILCALPSLSLDNLGGAWGRDGTILFSAEAGGGLWRVPSTGGTPVAVTKPDRARGERAHAWPRFLPDGRRFLYTARGAGSDPSVASSGSFDSDRPRRLLDVRSNAVCASRGDRLLFVRQRSLLSQGFDSQTLNLAGVPANVDRDFVRGSNSDSFFDESGGTLVHVTTRRDTALAWFDRTGRLIETVALEGVFNWPAIAPDDRRIAIDRDNPETGHREVWVLDGDRRSRLTFGPLSDSDVVWAPDGGRLAFAHDTGRSLEEIGLGATGGRKTLNRFSGNSDDVYPSDWSADGRWIAYGSFAQGNATDVFVVAAETDARPLAVAATRFNEHQARFSPDGRFIAYASDESGRPEVYVQAMPPGRGRWQASTAGGAQPMWRRDGRELFYLALDHTLMAVQVAVGPAFGTASPAPLFRIRLDESPFVDVRNHYAVTGDGKRFLVNSVTGGARLEVLTNWSQDDLP